MKNTAKTIRLPPCLFSKCKPNKCLEWNKKRIPSQKYPSSRDFTLSLRLLLSTAEIGAGGATPAVFGLPVSNKRLLYIFTELLFYIFFKVLLYILPGCCFVSSPSCCFISSPNCYFVSSPSCFISSQFFYSYLPKVSFFSLSGCFVSSWAAVWYIPRRLLYILSRLLLYIFLKKPVPRKLPVPKVPWLQSLHLFTSCSTEDHGVHLCSVEFSCLQLCEVVWSCLQLCAVVCSSKSWVELRADVQELGLLS